jgi:hypothetical protein
MTIELVSVANTTPNTGETEMTVTVTTISSTEIRVTDTNYNYKEFTGSDAAEKCEKFLSFRYGSARIVRTTSQKVLANDGYSV